MAAEPSIIDSININYDGFFEQERKVASYLLQNPRQVVNMTIGELAAACGTSVATVSRFCRKLGAESFHHMKVSLARDIVLSSPEVKVSNTITRDDIAGSLQGILANKVAELRQTVNLIDPEDLDQVLTLIQDAGTVQLAAVGNTIPVAIAGQFMFNEIGIRAVSGTVWETQMAFARQLREGDVLIAISNSGESRNIAKMVEVAKAGGAATIAITNNPSSTIAQAADHHIQTATREKLFLDEFFFSRVSAMAIIEILYLFLTVGNDVSYQNLSACESLFANEKV
ncbi:MAG: MurR/RpiR family transcriptional regulator [Atopobiaceae bacterium]|nr:MurR/RpiR family transcriptional regulator [Atopobiaceae bacterium]